MGLSKVSGSGIDANVITPANLHSTFVLPVSKVAKGPGSGLDADTLDGEHGAYYLDYTNFTNKPSPFDPSTLANVATSGSYADLSNTPTLANVATSGSYNDLSNKPTIPAAVTNNNQLTNGAGYTTHPNPAITSDGSTPSLNSGISAAEIRSLIGAGTGSGSSNFSGNYNDLSNKPTIPAAVTNNNQLTNGAGYITSASGGNADTVDNIHAASFLRSDTADVIGGTLSYHSNTARLQFRNTSYDTYLHIGGWTSSNDNNISRVRNSSGNLHIDSAANGNLYFNHYSTGSILMRGQTAWHAGNDGSGSGLDADLLDGQHGSYYRNASNINAGTFPDRFSNTTRYNIGYIDGVGANNYDKLRVWDSGSYAMGMHSGMSYGWLNDYAMTFTMNNESDRGFLWRDNSDSQSDGAMSLTTNGNLMVKNAIGIANKTGNYWKDGSWGFRHQTPHGYIEFGPANTSHAHIYTDRSNFYFNKTDIRANGNTMWHAANDGSGSGLDADTVDGIQGGNFLRSDTSDTASGEITFNGRINIRGHADWSDSEYAYFGSSDDWQMHYNSNNWLYINQKGNGIIFQDNGSNKMRLEDSGVFRPELNGNGQLGTSSYYWYYLYSQNATISGTLNCRGAIDLADNDILRFGSSDDVEFFCTSSHMYMDLNSGIGNFYIRDGTTTKYTFDDNGSFTAAGNVTAYSDIKLKRNIEVIPNALEKVCKLRGVTYDRIDLEGEENQRQTGVIAQEIEKVLPEVVTNENGIKAVAYGNIVGLLIESIKELKAEIETLKQERNQ